ncbi:PHP domain-containing protein [Candidatus Woesearchaeota archaeon]|nr:PHP domain-containing protein [Candidatus Woesearchaeota archaeon]
MGSVIFKKPPLKKLGKDGFFGIDMHFHTQYSLDAVSRITSAVKKAQKKGFGFAITDHNTIKGVMASYRLRKHALIIPGIEITCSNGNHVLAYFYDHPAIEEFYSKVVKPKMKTSPFFTQLSVAELLDASKNYNCVMCAPHPYAPGAVSIMNTGIKKNVEKKFNLIEVMNGYNFRQLNLKAVYWAAKADKGFTGGSDGHCTFELGRVLTFTQGTDTDSIFKAISKKQSMVVGKEDNFFLKAMLTVGKGSAYINKCHKNNLAKELIKEQFGVEYTYFRNRFSHRKARRFIEEHFSDEEEDEC